MRFPPSFLDEIKARLPVSDVVRRRVKLQKSGREFVGLSPFGKERTPSFFVNDGKMAWFDFSSGKNGNVFDFVMQTEGLSFPEAVERLASEAGLALPARSPEVERQEQKRAGLHEVLEWAAAFFEKELAGPGGGKARAYLDGRGVAANSRSEFRIGYAPADRHRLRDALAAKGASLDVMCEAGLLIHGADIPVAYDRFRDRVMFPINDRGGRVIAFGGRALEKDVQAKYLNSPETPVFHKGSVLFNHHRARKAAHDKGRIIVVEGYLDVVAMHAAGYGETVAPLGTALGEEQALLLWQMAEAPILCLDGDKAGRKAAHRAAELALPFIAAKRTLAFALLPDGHDPDELIRTSGPQAIEATIEAAVPLVDLLWAEQTEGRPLTTPEQRAGLERDLGAIAAAIRDEALRRLYRAEFADRLRRLFGTERGGSGTATGQRRFTPRRGGGMPPVERRGYLTAPLTASSSLTQSPAFRVGGGTLPPREAMIMVILVAQPTLAAAFAEHIATLEFAAQDLMPLRDRLLDIASEDVRSSAALRSALGDAGYAAALARLDKSGAGSAWYAQPSAAVEDAAIVLEQALTLHRKTRALHRELLSVHQALATDASEANLALMRDIQEQINTLTGAEAAVEGFGAASGRATGSI